VLHYFKKVENNERGADAFHGVGGPQNVADRPNPDPLSLALIEGAVATGLARNTDLNGKNQDGVGLCQFTQKAGKRHSTADAYLEPAHARQNLEVVTEVHSTRILLQKRRAVGVVYQRNGSTHEAHVTREVMLCRGPVNSPQLLMLSGIGPADHLRKLGIEVVQSLPGVGQNLQDHTVAPLLYSSNVPISLLAESSQVEAIAHVRTQNHLPAPDLQMFLVPVLWLREGLEPPTQDGFTVVFSVMKPRSVGALRLRMSDPFAPPAIDSAFLSDEKGEDRRVLREGFRLSRGIVATTPFAAFRGEELAPGLAARSDDEIDEHVRRLTQTHYHPVGTCKMGIDSNAVVDPTLRVHGIDALRVADASIMPTIPRANTNAAAIMIGEKAADLIKE
jgi:choline dehydrogenase